MRAFVAIDVSESEIINTIYKFQKNEFNINAKPVAPENLHFTIQFIGEISNEEGKLIKDRLDGIKFTPFSVVLKGVGIFPKPSFPRIIWIGTDKEGGEKMKNLAYKIREELEEIGYRADKPFEPHLTIFRIKNKIDDIREKMKQLSSKEFGSQTISEIKFKKSELTPQGPHYSNL